MFSDNAMARWHRLCKNVQTASKSRRRSSVHFISQPPDIIKVVGFWVTLFATILCSISNARKPSLKLAIVDLESKQNFGPTVALTYFQIPSAKQSRASNVKVLAWSSYTVTITLGCIIFFNLYRQMNRKRSEKIWFVN